jgi:hypothetical protein
MCRDRESPQADYIVNDIACFAPQRIWRLRKIERDHVAVARADFYGVNTQHSGAVSRSIRFSGSITVIGEHDEIETSAGGGRCDLVGCTGPVRSNGMDVDGPRNERRLVLSSRDRRAGRQCDDIRAACYRR